MPDNSTDQIRQIRKQEQRQVAAIEANEDFTADAKRRRIEEVQTQAREQRRQIVAARDAEEREALEVPEGVGLYPHEARAQYREAQARVVSMDDATLEQLYIRAQRSRDSVMLQAVYHEALSRGGNADVRELPPTAITAPVRIADNYRANNAKARERFEKYQALRASQADPLARIFNLM